MNRTDDRQSVFENYQVPDAIRIRKVCTFVRKHFPNLSGISLLECGIARGGLAEVLSREGAICYGVDINPRSIPGVEIVRADLNKGFPRFATLFDVIFAGEVMEHLFDDVAFVASCRELLKPGGLLIVTVPNLVFGVNRLLMLFGKMPMFAHAPYHYHIYTKKTLGELIERQGFRILKFSSSHVLFSTRRNRLGRIFEILGDIFPSFGAHLIVFATRI